MVEKFGIHSIAYQNQVLFNVSARLDKIIVYDNKPNTCVAVDYKVGGKRTSIDTDQIFINMAVLKLMHPGYEAYALEIQNLSDEGIDRALYRSNVLKGVVPSGHRPRPALPASRFVSGRAWGMLLVLPVVVRMPGNDGTRLDQ